MVPDPNEDLIRTDRSRLIQRSSRCFYFGLVGLIPLVGIVPAALAIRLHHRVAHDTGESEPETDGRAGGATSAH